MNTVELKNRVDTYIDTQTDIPSKKEFVKMMGKIYSDIEKGKDAKVKKQPKEGEEKKKREPTPYNYFMREQMAILKEKETEGEEKMTAKAKMEHIAALWEQKKAEDREEEKPKEEKKEEKKDDEKPKKEKKEVKKEKKDAKKKDGEEE
jgi:hypothetical protein